MDKEFIITYLQKRNYWWKTGSVNPVDKGNIRQEYLGKIQYLNKLERIICLTGIRRSGKTTVLYQYIDHLLNLSLSLNRSQKSNLNSNSNSNLNPTDSDAKKIVYVKIDDLIGKFDSIHDILNIYHELTGIDPSKEKVYFLLDEIHVQKDWQLQLKYYIDAHAECKFIISGSSKPLLYSDASESLAGRITFIDVFPLTFREFLKFNDIPIDEIASQSQNLCDFGDIEKAYHNALAHKNDIVHLLNQYFNTGGYPEWFKIKDMDMWHRTIVEDYFALILFKDIVSVFKVKDPLLLEKLVRDIAVFSTERFTYKGLSERLGVNRETLKLYLYYLQSSMMVFVADVYAPSKKAVEKRPKKLYFWEEGLRRALTLDKDDARSAENIVAWHLIKRGMGLRSFFSPRYWKNRYEVDFVYDDSKMVIPVKVKYRNQSAGSDVRGLVEFMGKYDLIGNPNVGIVVTKDIFKKEEFGEYTILHIPIWIFLIVV